jgi:uncharacterized Zn ribbon protein
MANIALRFGFSSAVQMGTKITNIRLVEGDHDIARGIDGIGAMRLKAKFVKKAWNQRVPQPPTG